LYITHKKYWVFFWHASKKCFSLPECPKVDVGWGFISYPIEGAYRTSRTLCLNLGQRSVGEMKRVEKYGKGRGKRKGVRKGG